MGILSQDMIEKCRIAFDKHDMNHNGELRDFDFAAKIQKYERQVEQFESALEAQHELFFKDTPFHYNPTHEV